VLLALPLLGSSLNHALGLWVPALPEGTSGAELWALIRTDGLMDWIAVGHFVIGILLLVPRTRFAAGLLQLPISVGIVGFNATGLPSGVPLAVAMLVGNLVVVASRDDLRRLFQRPTR